MTAKSAQLKRFQIHLSFYSTWDVILLKIEGCTEEYTFKNCNACLSKIPKFLRCATLIGPQEEKDGIQLFAFFAQIRSFTFKVEEATCIQNRPFCILLIPIWTLVTNWVFEVLNIKTLVVLNQQLPKPDEICTSCIIYFSSENNYFSFQKRLFCNWGLWFQIWSLRWQIFIRNLVALDQK